MEEVGGVYHINEYPTIEEIKAMCGLRPDQDFSEIDVDGEFIFPLDDEEDGDNESDA